MDPELLAALREANLLTDLTDEDLERLANIDNVATEELGALEQAMLAALDNVVDGAEEVTDAVIAAADSLREGIQAVRASAGARRTAEETRQARLASIVAQIRPPETTPNGDRPRTASHRPPLVRHKGGNAPRGNGWAPASTNASQIVTPAQVELADMDALIEAFANNARTFNSDGRVVVASIRSEYPEIRQLDKDDSLTTMRRIEGATSLEARAASGGLCAPLTPRYEVFDVAVADRPLRDALPAFQATRGGIRYIEPPRLADVADGVGVWTVANDVDPGSDGPATKPIVEVVCGGEQTVLVQAVTRRLRIGNFDQMTYPERAAVNLNLLMAEHARTAEQELLADISAASTATTTGQTYGAARDLLAMVERAAVAQRSRLRMGDQDVLRVLFPSVARGIMREDLARQQPGDAAMAVSDAELDNYFAVRNVSPIYTPDAQVFGAQAEGALIGWPDRVTFWLFPEGSFIFLDAGQLDIGLYRDSVLNKTNDAEIFGETFEACAFVGIECIEVTADVCPNGTFGGPSMSDPCSQGS